jgi:hypothetical protein
MFQPFNYLSFGGGLNIFPSPLDGGPLLNSRAPPVLMVEHLKVLLVEHLKVLSLTVEPACASLTVEHAYASYEIGHLTVAEVLEY